MTPDREIDWTAAGKLAENWARLCYPETPECNLARAYLDAMARLDKATELLRSVLACDTPGRREATDDAIRAFLDERAKHGE